MNDRSKYWFHVALGIMLIGAAAGPVDGRLSGGIMSVGSALFIYVACALWRARRLRQTIVADLTAERTFGVSRLVVNQSFSEQLFLYWHGKKYFDMAVCREEQLAGIRYGDNTQHLISLSPDKKICLKNDVVFKTIGHFSLGAVIVRISSDWGIVEVSCPVQINSQVLVHPKLYPSLSQGVQNSMVRSFSSGIHRFRYPGDGAELFEIRDYFPGDPFKKILWSATAKTGKLIVRENETEVNIPIMFLMNTSWFLRFGSPKMMFDQLAETALTIADSALQTGDPFGFCLYGDSDQSCSNCFILPDNRKDKLRILLHSLLTIRVQQTPPEQLDIPKIEKIIKNFLLAASGDVSGEDKDIMELLKQTGYIDVHFSSKDPSRYARLLNRIAEENSLPVPVLHSRLKAPDTVEKELELQEVGRLKQMLLKILPQVKGHAVFIAAVRPYEHSDALQALSNMLKSIPAFHHTLIVLYPDYASFAGIKPSAQLGSEDGVESILNDPYSAKTLIRLDYEQRFTAFSQDIRRSGGMLQNIDASQNAVFIMSAVERLRTIQGGRCHA